MAPKRCRSELSIRTRTLIIVAATFEGLLKIAALIDIAPRPADEIRESKAKWATDIVLVNSAGALPLYYFAQGRRPSAPPRWALEATWCTGLMGPRR